MILSADSINGVLYIREKDFSLEDFKTFEIMDEKDFYEDLKKDKNILSKVSSKIIAKKIHKEYGIQRF